MDAAGTAVAAECLVTLVLDETAHYQDVLLLQQAGLRVLRMHTASQQLLLAPSVLTVVGRAMDTHRSDDTTQHWGAETVCCLASIDPADLIRTHGQDQYAAMRRLFVQLAVNADRPATLLLDGTPWFDIVLQLYPRDRVDGVGGEITGLMANFDLLSDDGQRYTLTAYLASIKVCIVEFRDLVRSQRLVQGL
jgi:hypothetical protein